MMRVEAKLSRGAFALDVSFVHERGVTALFGRSGCGKTTTIGVIAGLLRPKHGRVEIGGDVLLDTELGIDVPSHRRRVGVVYQDAQLFPHMTVGQNLGFGRWFAGQRVGDVDTKPIIETLGIGHLLERRTAGLSGGERQRVAIGRALLAGPRVLLLDEPLASLDRERKQEILPLIEEVAARWDIPVIYVSHALGEVASLATQVVILDEGKVTAAGAPEDVLSGRGGAERDRFGVVSVIAGSLGDHDAQHGLTPLIHNAGTLFLASRLGPPGRRMRVVVRATDVALATQRPRSLSIRNVLEGTITEILAGEGPSVLASIALDGGGRLTASLTRLAVDELGLDRGDRVYALIKTAAIDERPAG